MITQSVESVVELLNYIGKPSKPLPEVVELRGLILVLSNKQDVYYATTANSCSCPSASYRPGQRCKHQRQHYSEKDIERQSKVETQDSIRPTEKWPGGHNGPVAPEEAV
jgi:hypothetical protein